MRRGRGLSAAALALALALLPLATPTAASAKPLEPWWSSALALDTYHQQVTGKGVRVAVIDGAINASAPDLEGAAVKLRKGVRRDGVTTVKTTSHPTAFFAGHGTAMTTLLVGQGTGNGPGGAGIRGVAPDAEVYFYEVDDDPTDRKLTGDAYTAFEQAIKDKVDIISYSISNSTGLSQVIKEAWDAGIVVIAGAGAAGELMGEPATIPGVVAVGAVDRDAKAWKDQPNLGGYITVNAPGVDIAAGSMEGTADGSRWVSGVERTGTSDATPLVAGALALVKQKYPDATGNQLVQQLIHTSSKTYAWDRDLGYGIVSIGTMLATDPAGWRDVNPLLEGPAAALKNYPRSSYRDPASPTKAPTSPARGTDDNDDATAAASDSSSSTPWVFGGVAVALVAASGATIIIRQRGRRDRQPVLTGQTGGSHDGT